MSEIYNKSLLKISEQYKNSLWLNVDKKFPVSLEKICDGIDVYVNLLYFDFEDKELNNNSISGKIFKNKESGYQIDVNAYEIPTRIRFTVAHEIGHFIQHKDLLDKQGEILERKDISLYSPEQLKQEREANAFAAELLMPEFYFIKQYKILLQQYSIDEVMAKLADYFWVSNTAINFRMLSLGINYA